MQIDEFKRILTTFANSPAEVDLTKGNLILEFQNDIIEAKLEFTTNRDICVIENNTKLDARDWIVKRLAHLPLLADRILSYIKAEDNFIIPKGILLDQLESSPKEDEKDIEDALQETRNMLNKSIPGAASILYLTSDAGEGKTTLINQLARSIAKDYKAKKIGWLLIPIPLAAKQLLHFDDMVVGTLMNKLRFQMLYYDSFVELVRLGVIVPAFDGFEEMFVESGSKEAVSALGNLVNMLRSSGNILISARRAYFEYKSFETQSHLFDSMGSAEVEFARLSLKRWDKQNFLAYCQKRNIQNGEQIYTDVNFRFNKTDHPLLTRAVLVRRLLDVAADNTNRQDLLKSLGDKPHEYFAQFVNAILKREVNEKWIYKSKTSSDAAKPLLSIEEHKELLSNVALEMWINSTDALREELLDLIAELFCEKNSKGLVISRQVKERIKQHALLTLPQENKPLYAFDHDDFRNYFLGEAIGGLIVSSAHSELRNILQIGLLSLDTLDAAIHYYSSMSNDAQKDIDFLLNLCSNDGPGSYIRENIGGLTIRLLHKLKLSNPLLITKVSFPPNALTNRELSMVHFESCYFQPSTIYKTILESCLFKDCTFERLELTNDIKVNSTQLSGTKIISVIAHESDMAVFSPEEIQVLLEKVGFEFSILGGDSNKFIETVTEENLILAQKAFRRFLRSTSVSEDVFKAKMGAKAHSFVREVLPKLKSEGILVKLPKRGGKIHYKLNVTMQEISIALAKCNGKFSDFLSIIHSAREK